MLKLMCVAMGLVPASACAQFYLITGTPNDSPNEASAALLTRVDGRHAKVESEIISAENGIGWIALSYDLQVAAIRASRSQNVAIFDLRRASVTKTCALPDGGAQLESWLTRIAGRPPMLQWEIWDGRGTPRSARELNLASADCQISSLPPLPDDAGGISLHGTAGSAGDFFYAGVTAQFDSTDRIGIMLQEGKPTVMLDAAPIPLELRKNAVGADLVIANEATIGLDLLNRSGLTHRLVALRRRDSTWHTMPPAGIARARAFGTWIATVESRWKKVVAEDCIIHPGCSGYKRTAEFYKDLGPGRNEWRKEDARLFENSEEYFPGRLHLYNIETERTYTIVTNQGDSEILLVENNIVYYRVSDRLYSAPITEKGIGTARLIAKDEIIRDSHWAFIKH